MADPDLLDDTCPECSGSGELDGDVCPECDGSGGLDPDELARRATSPQWRRAKAEHLGGLERREFSVVDVEIRDADRDTWNLTGYASVTETPYEVGFYTETIKRGAFKRTLRENPDVQLLVNHDGLPLARTRSGTLRLDERSRGLWVDADLDKRDPDAQRLQRKMARGDIDQMSFAFQVTDQDWNDDYTRRTIKVVNLHRGDVSVVNQGANPAATATVRAARAAARRARKARGPVRTAPSPEERLALLRAGRVLHIPGTSATGAPSLAGLNARDRGYLERLKGPSR